MLVFNDPKSQLQIQVNIAYTIMTIISLSAYAFSYYRKDPWYIFPAFYIVAIRNTVRMLDIEDSIQFQPPNIFIFSTVFR